MMDYQVELMQKREDLEEGFSSVISEDFPGVIIPDQKKISITRKYMRSGYMIPSSLYQILCCLFRLHALSTHFPFSFKNKMFASHDIQRL